jgi:hypothetical protein
MRWLPRTGRLPIACSLSRQLAGTWQTLVGSQLGAHLLRALALTQLWINRRKSCPDGLGTLA